MTKNDKLVIKRLKSFGYAGETRKRSWVKSLIWRVAGIFILGGITYAFTRNWAETTWITMIFHIIRTGLYYCHERMWDRIDWGRKLI